MLTPGALLAQARAVAPQSALDPGGPAAADIRWLWDVMFWLGGATTVLVVALLLVALFRRRRPDELPPEADRPPDPRGEYANEEGGGRGRAGEGRPRSETLGARWMVVGGVAFPVVVLAGIFLVSLDALGEMYPRRSDDPPLTIEVVGRQWWWEVRYLSDQSALIVPAANEIHIPVGMRVRVNLRSLDVIHSFWVPGLQGKVDMIPGRTNVTWLEATEPGVWRGQCAEFCGLQHAKMALVVVAQPADSFAVWLGRQLQPAPEPRDSALAHGRDVFLTAGCELCHTVRGTPARASAGPDLTHLASRLTLAAGELPNNRGNLYGWIANPQALKPGSKMPAVPLTAEELHAVVGYLSSLH
jgi:cytochrome c oxidase subunit 2